MRAGTSVLRPFAQRNNNDTANLNAKALGGLLGLLVVMAALLFVPAWTLNYGRAWAFLMVFGAAVLAITLYQ